MGCAKRNPCACSQPSPCRKANWFSVSTPSATTMNPRGCASSTMVRTIRVLLVVLDVLHERAVDLQRAHRKAREVRKARIPCAEVVDGDAHARLREALQRVHGELGILHQVALGDLELDQRGVDA